MISLHAISLWQPYASLWLTDLKADETRHWRYPDRLEGQTVAVHAALRADWPPERSELDDLCIGEFGLDYRRTLPRGAFLGTLRLAGCRPTDTTNPLHSANLICGNWAPGRFAWRGEQRSVFAAPIPAKGRQGWWIAEIEEALL